MRKPDAIPPPGARPSLASVPIIPPITPTPASSSSSNQNLIRGATGGSSPELEEEIELPPPYRSSLSKTGSNHSSSRRSSSIASSAVPPTKRKRPTHVRTPSEEGMATDERDDGDDQTDCGEQADSEFSEFRAWANVNTRRKSVTSGHMLDGIEDAYGRRHSMAV